MEEHNLIFGILSLLFVMSLILFANLCVKLDKKKQPNSDRYGQTRKPSTTESMQKLQSLAAIESATGSLDRSIPHRHLSINSSHYSDKRQRPFPSYTPFDKISHSHSRSNSSISPKSVNSLELSSQKPDLDRFRIGSESQKLRRDNPIVVTGHQRQRSMEVPRFSNHHPSHHSPLPGPKRPTHLLHHEQLKRTEPVPDFNRENSLRSSSSSALIAQKRSLYHPRSSPSSSVTTGVLPMEINTPNSPTADGSASEASRLKTATGTNPIVPKYSDSKAKGTPVRSARMELDEPSVVDSTSPYREYSNTPVTPYTDQTPTHNEIGLTPTSQYTEAISISKLHYQTPRLEKRQLSHEDSSYYPPYYQPATDSTCQLYSTQSNKSLPLRMRFPKLSNGTDFADDETEGTSVCQSLYSSYTSLYQTDTEEFMIGDPQAIKLSRDLESPYAPTTEHRTPLVAQCARQYTENLLRTTRRPSNLSEFSDSDVSFVWTGGDSGRHEYTPHDLSGSSDKRGVMLPRPGYRKQGYTDYTGGLSFFSFVRKDSIPEETQTIGMSTQRRPVASPSRFMNYPLYTRSPGYVPPEMPRFTYPSVDSTSGTYTQSQTPIHSNSLSQSNDNLKTPQRQLLTSRNSSSHPNLRSHKQSHSKSSGGAQLEIPSPIRTSPYYPKPGTYNNRNNSNNEVNSSGISLTHL